MPSYFYKVNVSSLTNKEHRHKCWNTQTCKLWSTLAVVRIHSIHARSSILALMTWTVVNVVVAVFSSKT